MSEKRIYLDHTFVREYIKQKLRTFKNRSFQTDLAVPPPDALPSSQRLD